MRDSGERRKKGEKPLITGSGGTSSGDGGGDLGAAMQFGVAIIVFTLAGWWLDSRIGTTPLFTLVGMSIGAGAGFFSMYRRLTEHERKKKGEPTPVAKKDERDARGRDSSGKPDGDMGRRR